MNQISKHTLSNPSTKRIACIQAGWHDDIVGQALKSFSARLNEAGIQDTQMDIMDVPGSLEIPLQAKLLAKTGQYDVIVGFGFVVDGGIYRHDFVASSIIDAFMQVQLETEIPILSVVLTPQNFHEHNAHQKFFYEHFVLKGQEAAQACIQTLANMEALQILKKVA